MTDIELIKKIILKLFVIKDDIVITDPLLFMDNELKDLLKQLKESK